MRISSMTATLLALTGIAANQASDPFATELGRFDDAFTFLATDERLNFNERHPSPHHFMEACDEDNDGGINVGELHRCIDRATPPSNSTGFNTTIVKAGFDMLFNPIDTS